MIIFVTYIPIGEKLYSKSERNCNTNNTSNYIHNNYNYYYGHISRHNSLANTIIQGKVEGARSRGRPKKDWMSNITLWTYKSLDELLEKTRDRDRCRKVVIVASNMIPPTMHASRD